MKGRLILENGMIFDGECFGYLKDSIGEVVFNTGMTGYQEILTDPSYYGQIVVMTYPLIGNYGINYEDTQSKNVKVRGFVVRETCHSPSNWRNEISFDAYLKEEKIIGIKGLDTRHLTKVISKEGALRGIITTDNLTYNDATRLLQTNPTLNAVKSVTTRNIEKIEGNGKHMAIIDLGIKSNIIKSFKDRDFRITIMPAFSTFSEIMAIEPDCVFLSNGPGDPKELASVIDTAKRIIGKIPITGICLGHQIIALACGADTEKMKYGHRGSNHPVKNLKSQRVTITSQNHGYVVIQNTLPDDVEITHVNMNDFTIEGIKNESKKLMSVQFHPEASPGPGESHYIFDEFMTLM
ncbi:MAG: Carbamoyl-phosphate synthase small chain [Clostridiales bacterium 38_11]|nr:MAG: Carbamoyl-phosphate synthase small chain [Clostridiales bacterium 38_11]HBH12055.1 carbamoyl phosphate synthase small subunit [Clostridiales bacterium]